MQPPYSSVCYLHCATPCQPCPVHELPGAWVQGISGR